jgi:hypothetical protein
MIFAALTIAALVNAAPNPAIFNVQQEVDLKRLLYEPRFPKFKVAAGFLNFTNGYLAKARKDLNEASWAYATNITDHNAEVQTDVEVNRTATNFSI